MDPTPIASQVFVQYGALAFVAASGWVAAYMLWGALNRARVEIAALNEKIIVALSNNTQAVTMLSERIRRDP